MIFCKTYEMYGQNCERTWRKICKLSHLADVEKIVRNSNRNLVGQDKFGETLTKLCLALGENVLAKMLPL